MNLHTSGNRHDKNRLSDVVRIVIASSFLGVILVAMNRFVGATDPTDGNTLRTRILLGCVVSLGVIGLIFVLARQARRDPQREAAVQPLTGGLPAALRGIVFWLVPAAVAFGVLAICGIQLEMTVSVGQMASTTGLLFMAVLLTEAIPEELIFRGYVTSTLSRHLRGWWIIISQAVIFTVFAGLIRDNWNVLDLSLFVSMGIGLGYMRAVTGSIWTGIGFHAAFQTGSQMVMTHELIRFSGDQQTAMVALGVVPFAVAAMIVTAHNSGGKASTPH